jgi:hypothetical protein
MPMASQPMRLIRLFGMSAGHVEDSRLFRVN